MDTHNGSEGQVITYQKPPKPIEELAEAPVTPGIFISPNNRWLVELERRGMLSIEELAEEELRLGGLRLNPETYTPSRVLFFVGMKFRLINAQDGEFREVKGLPANKKILDLSWSPDSRYLAFTLLQEEGLGLWVADPATGDAKRITNCLLNNTIGSMPYRWVTGSTSIIFRAILNNRPGPPVQSNVPLGPVVQENVGGRAPVHTFQDLLKNPYEERLFEYYTQSSLHFLDVDRQLDRPMGIEGMIYSFSISPDGNYVIVRFIKRPFSYSVPYSRFASEVVLFTKTGEKVRTLAALPVFDNIPVSIGSVPTGPRNFGWRSDHPALVYWVEARDGGDIRVEAPIRDTMYYLEAPFDGDPREALSFELRFSSVAWCRGNLSVVREWKWAERKIITSLWAPDHPGSGKQLIFEHIFEDVYNDPGEFVTVSNASGHLVLLTDKEGHLFLKGLGASPEGNRPFLDRYDPTALSRARLWRSEGLCFEMPICLVDVEKGLLLIRRESQKDPPNIYLRDLRKEQQRSVTHYPNPFKLLEVVKKEMIHYKRADGVELTGMLYLPAGYQKKDGQRLPVFMWAYPREYKSAKAAGQVTDSPYTFHRLFWGSPVYWALHGYAIFDNFSMPIVGEGKAEPNERFIEQLQMSAEAAVNKLVDCGIADPDRIAVGGHSYGAFMTAHLLAHTNLFAAGIARSGAYNRTLTPFGFQHEERSFWEAPDVYMKMSPFTHADKINAPLLLIHGEADNNSGTFPMQSERFYAALKGQGAIVRLVKLPHESHGYQARESILHMMWEMTEWLDKYVKK